MKNTRFIVLVKKKFKKVWHWTFISRTDGVEHQPLNCGHAVDKIDSPAVFNSVMEAKTAAWEFHHIKLKEGKKFTAAKIVEISFGKEVFVDLEKDGYSWVTGM